MDLNFKILTILNEDENIVPNSKDLFKPRRIEEREKEFLELFDIEKLLKKLILVEVKYGITINKKRERFRVFYAVFSTEIFQGEKDFRIISKKPILESKRFTNILISRLNSTTIRDTLINEGFLILMEQKI